MLSRRLFLSSVAGLVATGASAAFAGATPLTGFDPLAFPSRGLTGGGPLDPAVRANRVDWLDRHTTEVDSFDFGDDEFADLEAFGNAVGDARIVMLGEQTHGDGTTFRAKARLIRYLHEEKGFDVLAFESGLFDMRKVWEQIRAGEGARKSARSGMFWMWSESQQVRPLIDYVGRRADRRRPLEIAGFDCQITGKASGDHLIRDLTGFLATHGVDTETIAEWPRFRSVLSRVLESWNSAWKLSMEERDLLHATFDAVSGRIGSVEGADAAFWRQMLKSLRVQMQLYFQVEPQNGTTADFNLRDQAMADNLSWLAREAYPQRKIIVWAASLHIMRNMQGLDAEPELVTMGHRIRQAFGDAVYTVGFTSHDGQRGWVGREPTPVAPAQPDSLEDLWAATRHDRAFLDLRQVPAGGEWLRESMAGYPVGDQLTKVEWAQMFDAVMFLRRMRPATKP